MTTTRRNAWVELDGRPPAGPALRRRDVYPDPVVDGQVHSDTFLARLAARVRELLTSNTERFEADLSARLAAAAPTRTNHIAVVSPKGGVGKTTCTFLIGNALAAFPRLRVLAADANRDFGTLASLVPDAARSQRSLADLLEDLPSIDSATALSRYVSRVPSGLHILAAPTDPRAMAQIGPDEYGQLLAFVGRYYDVILLDLGTGIVDPGAQFGIQRADQALIVTTPEYVTVEKVLAALRYLGDDDGGRYTAQSVDGTQGKQLTVVLNQVPDKRSGDWREIEHAFHRAGIHNRVALPYDQQLRLMLDSATYSLESLRLPTRGPIKELAADVAAALV